METEGKILKETCSTIRSILVVFVHIYYDQIGFCAGFVAEISIEIMRGGPSCCCCGERERSIFVKRFKHTSLNKSDT